MSAGFTKGPWEWWDDGESLVRITEAAEQKLIAQTALPSNACLIAAAPELYEACEAAEFLLAALCVERDSDTRVKLRSAIAKVGASHVDA